VGVRFQSALGKLLEKPEADSIDVPLAEPPSAPDHYSQYPRGHLGRGLLRGDASVYGVVLARAQ